MYNARWLDCVKRGYLITMAIVYRCDDKKYFNFKRWIQMNECEINNDTVEDLKEQVKYLKKRIREADRDQEISDIEDRLTRVEEFQTKIIDELLKKSLAKL